MVSEEGYVEEYFPNSITKGMINHVIGNFSSGSEIR